MKNRILSVISLLGLALLCVDAQGVVRVRPAKRAQKKTHQEARRKKKQLAKKKQLKKKQLRKKKQLAKKKQLRKKKQTKKKQTRKKKQLKGKKGNRRRAAARAAARRAARRAAAEAAEADAEEADADAAESDEEALECFVCRDEDVELVALPCYHNDEDGVRRLNHPDAHICQGCLDRILYPARDVEYGRPDPRCPLCRRRFVA